MILKRIGCFCVAGILVLGLNACAAEPVKTVDIRLNTQELSLLPGESRTITAEVTADSKTVPMPDLQWSSSDESVVTVKEGTVTAEAEGTATVSAVCRYGELTCTATATVTVCMQTLYIEPEKPVILDLSQQIGGAVSFCLPVDKDDAEYVLVGDMELRIISQAEQVLIDANSLSPGEYTMTLLRGQQKVIFPVYVVSMVIYDAEDLKEATQMPDAETGYFILGNNIDCADLNEPICFLEDSYFETSLGQGRQGFRGCFNGMGYTIFNLQVPQNGLFGCIGYPGEVKNLALKNLSSSEAEYYALCKDSAGLISQVYVQGNVSRMMYASYGPDNKLENIVVETTCPNAMICQHIASVDTDGYSVSDVQSMLIIGAGAKISGWSRTGQFSNLTSNDDLRVYSGTSSDSIPEVTEDFSFNGYWDISSGYPIFSSSVQ